MLLEINFNNQLKDNPTYFEYSIYYDSEIRNLKKKKKLYIIELHTKNSRCLKINYCSFMRRQQVEKYGYYCPLFDVSISY